MPAKTTKTSKAATKIHPFLKGFKIQNRVTILFNGLPILGATVNCRQPKNNREMSRMLKALTEPVQGRKVVDKDL
jgi:hypothetical protein